MKNATLRQLKVFESVARNLSFTQAGRELHLSQPAVSAQVKQLEHHAGMPLFEQLGKKVFLTPAGSELLEHTRTIIEQFREANEALQELKGVSGGTLVVSVISAGDYFFPHLLAAFVRANAGVTLDLRLANRADLLQQLADNQTDLGILVRVPDDDDLVTERFAPHPYVIVAAPNHPLARKRDIALAALAREPFVVREERSDTWHTMAKALGPWMPGLRIGLEIASNETIKQAVMAGMGIAFLSAYAVALELQVGRLAMLDVRGFPHMENWYVVHRRGKRLPAVAKAFKEFLRKEGATIIESVTRVSAQGLGKHRRATKGPARTTRRPR